MPQSETPYERSRRLLDEHHEFPGPHTLKVIGKSDDQFVERVVAAVGESLASDTPPPYSTRKTPDGRHVSITLQPTVDSPEQVLQLYERLRQIDGVVTLL